MGVLKRKNGFTLIESLAVVAILAILMTMSIFTFMTQLTKGRDAKRKADLEKLRTVLEDYLNDESCYPPSLVCRSDFSPYLTQVPCDPLGNISYFYSYDDASSCKSWYKIYAKLENINDPIITEVGCRESTECPRGGCGPGCNYNYWISSPNMAEVGRLPGENWPAIPTSGPTSPPLPTNTPPIVSTPTPGGPIPTSTSAPTATPVPITTPSPSPTAGPIGDRWGCFSGSCQPLSLLYCQPNYASSDCFGMCALGETYECK